MAGGECRIFERPQYVVLGRNSYDQRWIDGNIEAGIGGCGWRRPAKRPEEWTKGKAAKPARKRGIVQRVKDRVIGPADSRPPAAPPGPPVSFPPVPHIQPPAPEPAPPPAPAPAKPRNPVDELLDP